MICRLALVLALALSNSVAAVREANVNSQVIRLPVIGRSDIRFERLSTAQGLSQTKVSQITEDGKGQMWFGTQYGLDRYDGYNFKVFVNDPKDQNSLSGVFVGALLKDRDDVLWIGCGQFLDRFDAVTETFKRYPIELVNHISQDGAGTLWLATGKGLHSLNPATGEIRHYSHDPADLTSLSSNDVKSSGEDREGNLWVATSEGLDEFDRRTAKVTLHVPLHETTREVSFYEDRFGVFWIVHSTGNGLAVLDRKTNTLTHYSFYDRDPPSTAISGVSAILEDRSGNLWFGTHRAGLLKFDREHRRFIRYRNNPADPDSLARDGISTLFEDREGGIWAAVVDAGVARFKTRPPSFQRLPRDIGNPNDHGEPFVSAIYQDHQGVLWIGTRGQALTRLNLQTGQHTLYRPAESQVNPDIISIIEDPRGGLWAGTFNSGLLLFDQKTGRFKTYRYSSKDPYSLSNDIVTRLLVDHDGTLWAATWDGLNKFDASTGHFTRYKLNPDVRDLLYLELTQDPQGALWLGTHSSGVHRFEPKTGKFTVYEHRLDHPGTLSDNRVNSVHFDRSGTMWAGTQNSLNQFDSRNARFSVFTEQDGLSGNAVGCILDDGGDHLWMSTNNGLSSLDLRSHTFTTYSTADGLPGLDLTGWGACFKSPAGEMFFGGFSGGIAFYPDKVAENADIPSILLTDFRLFGRPVRIGNRSPLTKAISYSEGVTLQHEQTVFSLEFSALNYFHPETTRYRYRLDGMDRQWNEAGSNQRTVTYSALPSGDYRFHVQASSNHGPWSEPGVELNIRILPPWWGSWWFRAIYIAVMILLLWGAYGYRLHQIARQFNIRLEERVEERTRIARELHDTFCNVELNFASRSIPSVLPAGRPAALQCRCKTRSSSSGRTGFVT